MITVESYEVSEMISKVVDDNDCETFWGDTFWSVSTVTELYDVNANAALENESLASTIKVYNCWA